MIVALPLCIGLGMFVYVARAALGGGANLICTVLLLALAAHVALGRPLGRDLHLQLDNTVAENKNRIVLGFVASLVAHGIFDTATIFFMPVGHTYNDLDAAFGPLITSMLAVVVPTISKLLRFIENAFASKKVRVVRDLPHLWDFTAHLEPKMHNISGFANTQQSSGMHEFRFTRDGEGSVRMLARQSSQASTWHTEGEGDLVFRTVPGIEEVPPIAPMKCDRAWDKTSVSCNVRRWLPYLGLAADEMTAAADEWEAVFASLPPDGDVSRLAESSLMEWPVLPCRAARNYAPIDFMAGTYMFCLPLLQPRKQLTAHLYLLTDDSFPVDMVENPPVNPITGADRTITAVRNELRNHHTNLRRNNNSTPPIFLSDYIFFTLPRKGVRLGRVAQAPYGGALLENDTIDVTEYEHSAQDGINGFFGTFKPLNNPEYDPKTRNCLAFVRHRDVKRGNIVVFNVQMFGRPTDLRVKLASLRDLAQALPDTCGLPKNIPRSHAAEAQSGSSQDPPQLALMGPESACAERPLVKKHDRIEVYWEEDPQGWFAGVVTSNKREDDSWVSRIQYDACPEWPSHSEWHFLDPSHPEHVTWRAATA